MEAHDYAEASPVHRLRVAEEAAEYDALSPATALQRIKHLEGRMYRHARDLEFEEAARIRDQIARIRTAALGMPAREAV